MNEINLILDETDVLNVDNSLSNEQVIEILAYLEGNPDEIIKLAVQRLGDQYEIINRFSFN